MCVCMCVFPFFNGFCDQRQHPRSDKLKLSPQGDTVATEQANQKTKKKKESEERTKKKKAQFSTKTLGKKSRRFKQNTHRPAKKGGNTERRILITTNRSGSAAFGLWLLC